MTVTVNDAVYDAEQAVSLKTFLTGRQLPTEGVAVAHEGRIIPRANWDNVWIEDGMELTMIQAVSGG